MSTGCSAFKHRWVGWVVVGLCRRLNRCMHGTRRVSDNCRVLTSAEVKC